MKKIIQNVIFVCAMLAVGAVKADTLYEVETSGLVFKDTLSVEVFSDPDYPKHHLLCQSAVSLYEYRRSD